MEIKGMKSTGMKFIIPAVAIIVIVIAIIVFYLFMPMVKGGKTQYVFIDNDDTIDSVYAKVGKYSNGYSMNAFRLLSRQMNYAANIRPGHYAIEEGVSTLTTFRHIRNGVQAPINLTIPSVRTLERLSEEVSKRLLLSKEDLLKALMDSATCAKYGEDTLNIQCIFIPNTYDIYWDVTVDKFLDRMKTESDKFWNDDRKQKAKAMNMTPEQVITMASIVDEETANDGEKPMVAGMYYNRYKIGMPLQADPTVKYALKEFGLRRILLKHLTVESPYNTYKVIGLPPGPIRIPSVVGIDAVLDHVNHDYLFMCAKEDFSGTHNFAVTYEEHQKNAARYAAALNARGIK